MKTKKENILVLVTAGKESKRFMELAKDAAKAGNGDLYILHVAQGENILESGEMYEMQRLADYGCRLGGQVCLCCEQDVAAYISRFAKDKKTPYKLIFLKKTLHFFLDFLREIATAVFRRKHIQYLHKIRKLKSSVMIRISAFFVFF